MKDEKTNEIEVDKKCYKCDNDAKYYISIEKRIVPLSTILLIGNIPLDKQFSSYQLCQDCAEKEKWDLDENKEIFKKY